MIFCMNQKSKIIVYNSSKIVLENESDISMYRGKINVDHGNVNVSNGGFINI